ncbi:MAG: sulfatase-like hydrolase/transferase [Gammaproteobacteria bacterium]|nr:sulfatase-like hydrolase/transferase [Gammaproteobacteria bacterium]
MLTRFLSLQFPQQRLQRIAILFGLALIPFALARMALVVVYWDDFASLPATEIILASIYGLRFDLAVLMKFFGIPLLASLIPAAWAYRLGWQKFCFALCYVFLIVLVFALVADLIYFGFVHRHVGAEIVLFSGNKPLMIEMLFYEHGVTILFFTIAASSFIWLALRAVTPLHPYPMTSAKAYGVWIVIFLSFVLIGRGGWQLKPLSVSDAFEISSSSAGYIALNGAFAIASAINTPKPTVKKFMADDKAVSLVQANLTQQGVSFSNPDYPLMRRIEPEANASAFKPNVVVLLLESWDAIHSDFFRTNMGLAPLGLMPNFDALAKQGLMFTRHYAVGQRSMDGLAATLASIPTLPAMPYIGKGLEQNALPFLGTLAKQVGYENILIQSSVRGSFHVDVISKRAGFDAYYGAEDIPDIKDHSTRKSSWGAWDYETLSYANILFSRAQPPFLGFVFTATTHNPWRVPKDDWHHFPPEDNTKRFYNSVRYVDWALGEYIQAAKNAGYYDNTIFVITGDHISKFNRTQTMEARYHVPLLFIGPGIKPELNHRLASQLDIVPSIVDLANWNVEFSGFGMSLFKPLPQSRKIFAVNGSLVDILDKDSGLSHNLNTIVNRVGGLSANQYSVLETQLRAVYQTATTTLLGNKVYHAP